jgi:acyl carrier protein
MKIEEFVRNFSELFEQIDNNHFAPSTRFRDIEEWSSLMALSVIAMVDEKYHLKLTGADIQNAKTIEDLFNIVRSK